ncbi:(2Fe-2S)-binding protein [Streptomyces sp. NPDC059740]|uniref:(2Fe-2S)-binding protein n=1 Tax=Streptomyces sp. NPDC059740 TaxID=3346926 RepID=UPI00364F13AB
MGTTTALTLHVNGERHSRVVDNRTTLLDLLREEIGLTGAKKGCDHGQCGACTVLLDDRRVNSCLMLALSAREGQVTTVEGLADGDTLHPLQEAFLAHDGYQCGFCTPGQLCSGVAALAEARAGWPSSVTAQDTPPGPVTLDRTEIKERLSGNLCRCGAYVHIVDAVAEAAR